MTVVRVCEWCGDEFSAASTRVMYCRPSHRQRAYEARRETNGVVADLDNAAAVDRLRRVLGGGRLDEAALRRPTVLRARVEELRDAARATMQTSRWSPNIIDQARWRMAAGLSEQLNDVYTGTRPIRLGRQVVALEQIGAALVDPTRDDDMGFGEQWNRIQR